MIYLLPLSCHGVLLRSKYFLWQPVLSTH